MNDSVPTEVPRNSNERDMTESKMKKSATTQEEEATSWDTDAFDEKVKKDGKWKGSKEKKATRVQDISMSLVSGHGEHEQPTGDKNKESWPFDSSPCRMFGGKNTKGDGNNAPVNKELFKTEFGEIQTGSRTESEESLEYHDSDDESDSSDDDDDDDANSFGEESEEVEIEVEVEVDVEEDVRIVQGRRNDSSPEKSILKRDSALRKAPHRQESSSSAKYNSRSTRSTDSNESGESRSSRSSRRSTEKANTQQPARRSLRRSDSDRRLSLKKRDAMGGSCHPNIETKNNRRSSTKKPSSSLASATTHVSGGRTRRSAGLDRTKSSDGLEAVRPPPKRGDGLGKSVSFHGDDDIRRPPRRSDRKSSSKSDRRGRLTRAMSTHNVKPPERALSTHNVRPPERTTDDSSSARKERTIAPTVTPDGQPSKKVGPRSEIKSRKSSSKTSSTHRSRHDGSDSEASADGKRNTRRASKRGTSSANEEPNKAVSPEAAPRRDLMVLLREQKTVQPSDLMDQENRRLLHFLAYEHKMGLSLKELRRSVSADA